MNTEIAFSYIISVICYKSEHDVLLCNKPDFRKYVFGTKRLVDDFFKCIPNLLYVFLGCVEKTNKKKVREKKVYYISERLLHNSTLQTVIC